MLRLGLVKALHGNGGHYRKTDSGSRQDGDSDGQKVAAVLKGRTVYVDRRGVGYVSDRIGTIAGHRTGGMDL